MRDDFNLRFKDAEWYASNAQAIVGGAGGIGSWLSLFLTRAGISISVFDHDIVSVQNIGGQLYRTIDIKKSKVVSLAEIVSQFTDVKINAFSQRFDADSMAHSIMLSGFDNMDARTIFFSKWKSYVNIMEESKKKEAIFIDGRLNAEQLQIFSIRGNDVEHQDIYQRDHLFLDSDVTEGVCSFRQTTHVAAMIASYMTAILTNHLSNIKIGAPARRVPFKYEIFTPILFVETL